MFLAQLQCFGKAKREAGENPARNRRCMRGVVDFIDESRSLGNREGGNQQRQGSNSLRNASQKTCIKYRTSALRNFKAVCFFSSTQKYGCGEKYRHSFFYCAERDEGRI